MRKLLVATAGATVLAGAVLVSTAVASPGGVSPTGGPSVSASPSPSPSAPPVPTAGPVVSGTLDGGTRAKQDGIVVRTRDDATVRTFTLTYPAGAVSGWHRHPGVVLATVESGTVVQQVGCRRTVWQAGQSFTEVDPHQVRNPSTSDPAVLRITQVVPVGATLRENVDPPRCRRS